MWQATTQSRREMEVQTNKKRCSRDSSSLPRMCKNHDVGNPYTFSPHVWPPGARIVSYGTMKAGRVLHKESWLPGQARPPLPDCLRRSLLLCHDRRELSSSKKNMSQNEKVLTSEPLSRPSTGPSRQSLCRKIDSHSRTHHLARNSIHNEGLCHK